MLAQKSLARAPCLLATALAVAGFASDLCPISLFMGFSIYLGGFFGFLALLGLGRMAGIAVLVISSCAAALRGDYVFIAIALSEALAVCLAFGKRRSNVALLDAVFWFAIGIALSFVARLLSGYPAREALLSAFLLAVSGICQSAIASLLLDILCHVAPRGLSLPGLAFAKSVPYCRVIFEDILALSLLPLMAFLFVTSQSRIKGGELEMHNKLEAASLAYGILERMWLKDKEGELSAVAEEASKSGSAFLDVLKTRGAELLDLDRETAGALDAEGRVVDSSFQETARRIGERGADLSKTGAFASASASGRVAASAELDAQGRVLFLFVSPLAGRKGAAFYAIDTSSFKEILAGITRPLMADAWLIDPLGRLVASSRPEGELDRGAPKEGLQPFSLSEDFIHSDGDPYRLDRVGRGLAAASLYSAQNAGFGSGWRVIFALKIGPLRDTVIATGLGLCGFVLVAALLILILSLASSGIIVSSIVSLRRAAEAFVENSGRYDGVWPESDIDEVSGLSRAMQSASDMLERRYRETLNALGAAKRASESKERLLEAVSHDVRGPLAGIDGMAGILEAELSDEGEKESLGLIRSTAKGLREYVESLLDRSAIETGHFEIRSEPFSIRALLDEVEAVYRSTAASKGIELRFEVDPSLPERLKGDGRRLSQLLGNLVGNAVKYTERGSVRVSAFPGGEAESASLLPIVFEVRDTGIGIPKDKLPRIFEPYFRGDESAPVGESRGLGLAIVDGIVRSMRGSISVESEVGAGSRFRVSLSLARLEDGLGAGWDGESPAERKARVLVADDLRINRSIARKILEGGGNEVVEAEDGTAALRLAARGDFDLVLLDIAMPGIDGREVARDIRSRFGAMGPDARAPFLVALTASASASEDLRDCGFDEVLHKPASSEAILGAVRRATAGPSSRLAIGVEEEATAVPISFAPAGPSPSLVDYEGLLRAYGGDRAFLRSMLELFVSDGSRVIAELRGFDAARGAEAMAGLLHKAVNIIGTSHASEAVSLLRTAESSLRASIESGGEPGEDWARGLESGLRAADQAIAEARAYLETEGN